MRLNKYIAQSTDYSRRSADQLVTDGRVKVNDILPKNGQDITNTDSVSIDGRVIQPRSEHMTIMLNKPRGYVCSTDGQGSKSIYELLPPELQYLNSVGRLDKDSSGLLLMTSDGELANQLTHPRFQKVKIYQVILNKPLQPLHQQMISDHGINLEDGVSKLIIEKSDHVGRKLQITMHEGRNRQIRRTFESLGYEVRLLHRLQFGDYVLREVLEGQFKVV